VGQVEKQIYNVVYQNERSRKSLLEITVMYIRPT